MDSKLKRCRSLPPLVEGKIYGYLKLIIDEIVWSKQSPGNVSVLASWWGENNSLHFKPADIKSKLSCENETEALYVIKTNKTLFQEYIKNCETLELVIILENTNEIIGTARVFNLLDIFKHRPFSRYFPILNVNKMRIGDIHVVIQLLNSPLITDPKRSLTSNFSKLKRDQNLDDDVLNKIEHLSLDDENQRYNNYNTALKSNNDKFVVQRSTKKGVHEVTDKLVAQVIARAQRLRGIMLKESQDDPLALSDNSYLDNLNLVCENKQDHDLYELMLGKKTNLDMLESRALKPTSPTQSLIEFTNKIAAQSLQSDSDLSKQKSAKASMRSEELESESEREQNITIVKSKEPSPLSYVDSLRIIIESLSLNSAGYRRVISSCVSRDQRSISSITFFVHYDPVFTVVNDSKNKIPKDRKIVKIFSRKQYEDVIHFNHKAIYNVPKSSIRLCLPLKFKVYHRHLNQRSPTELGVGSMQVSDTISTKYLSTTQRVAIVNKGIKVAELKVTIELGCDGIHFGKEFVDAILCEKENIPVVENSSTSINNIGIRYRTKTGTESTKNAAVSTAQSASITSSSVSDSYSGKNETMRRNNDNMMFKHCSTDNNIKDKILLHGLIYISEGKDLPSLNTFLICRAFWREDKAASDVCSNTDKPFYNFHQLIPIIHGQEFLDRTKHNYIITEVYSKTNSGENLIGIAKLPVHQLYVAYRDPLVLPYLTTSKYPVISVDGWVNVVDLVSGQYCGQILALVAVGTADQIALLEMTRGLRNSCITPRTLQDCADVMAYDQTSQSNYNHDEHDILLANQHPHTDKYPIETCRSQECQTEITTVEEAKTRDDCNTSEEVPLHTIVDQLAQVVRHCKTHHDVEMEQNERTNIPLIEKRLKPLQIPAARSNVLLSSDESSIDSPGDNLPSAMYRSVGVGAEFNEETAAPQFPISQPQQQQQQASSVEHSDTEEIQDTCSGSFKATVEIECAYHLPMVEKVHETVEPSTYVTFQSAMDSINGRGSNVVTNVCLRTCTPKWDWKCSTRLSRELVNNKDKRLILKIWRLYDPDKNVQVDHEKDIVIGIAAIDLSVFLVGFHVLCGWFNIINYNGKIIGQIRVSITPLENLVNMDSNQFTNSNPAVNYPSSVNSEDNDNHNLKINDDMDIMLQSDTESISFLSHSLKQKLTELNEITMRLQSRLNDVTKDAFEDYFDEFQPIESDGENDVETNENRKSNTLEKTEGWSSAQEAPNNCNSNYANHPSAGGSSSKFSFSCDGDSNYMRNSNASTFSNYHLPGSSTNTYTSKSKLDYLPNDASIQKSTSSSASTSNDAYPVKGTKVHINHLLDKLSVQFGSHSRPPFPVQGNVIDILDSLRYRNYHDSNANTKRTNSILTQTDSSIKNTSDGNIESLPKPAKMSNIIREELVAEENDSSHEFDELSRHLIASNVRHMGGADNCTNPLFYEHLIPDVTTLTEVEAQSPENEAVKQLDSRYVENFSMTVNNGLQRLRNLPDFEKALSHEKSTRNSADVETLNFRLTPSGVSENLDGNIDITVAQQSSNEDLIENNESETESSSDKVSVRSVRDDDERAMTSSESSTSIISRQAPDGGNPIEESSSSTVVNQNESSSS